MTWDNAIPAANRSLAKLARIHLHLSNLLVNSSQVRRLRQAAER
jgi:hypothetical protein